MHRNKPAPLPQPNAPGRVADPVHNQQLHGSSNGGSPPKVLHHPPAAWDDFLTRSSNGPGKSPKRAPLAGGGWPGPRRVDPKHHVQPLSVVGMAVGPHPVHTMPFATHHHSQQAQSQQPQLSPSGGKHLNPLPEIGAGAARSSQASPTHSNTTGPTAAALPDLIRSPLDLGGRKIIFVLGGPGSGKGTQCVQLAKEFHLTHLSAGDLLRAEVAKGSRLGQELNKIMAEGQLVPMSVTINLLRAGLLASLASSPSSPGFLIDGFPRELDQATAFEDATHLSPDLVLFFDCPLATLEQRLLERGKTSGRADDNLESIQKRFKTFQTQSMPVVEHYRAQGKVLTISSVHSVETVYAMTRGGMLNRIKEWRPKPGVELNKRPLIFVLGGPGSGKGTQCAKIKELYSLAHLSVGDLLRAEVASGSSLGTTINDYIKDGQIVPMHVTLALVKKAVDSADPSSQGFLIDGFPREIGQAVEWERAMCTPDLVLFYDCPLALLERRLLKRGETSGRADDNLESIQKRFKTFQTQSMPVVEYYKAVGKVAWISSDATVEQVLEETKRVVEGVKWEDAGKNRLKEVEFTNVVFVLGGPGCGKGTQCANLVQSLGYLHLSTGDLLRAEVAAGSPIGKQADAIMKDGGMVPIDMIRSLLLAAMRKNPSAPGYLVDGYPRTLEQAQDIVMIVPPRFVLYFDCPPEVLVQRLLKRGETSGRADDNAESIKKRIDTFHAATMPVIEFFNGHGVVRKIDATRTIEEITNETLGVFA